MSVWDLFGRRTPKPPPAPPAPFEGFVWGDERKANLGSQLEELLVHVGECEQGERVLDRIDLARRLDCDG